jgi:glc operon protein GlcG
MYLERLDGAALHTPEVAAGKARTSATMQIPTGVLEDAVKDRSSILAARERTLLRGGIPIMHEGHCLGGIGVAGVLGTQDEEIARVGADAFSALWGANKKK